MSGRRVGFCLSDKKRKRMNLDAFAEFCAGHGVEVVEIDLSQPLVPQGPFNVIIHKLSDVIVEAEHDSQLQQLLANFQSYVSAHPTTALLDPLPAMTQLLDRFASYRIMSKLHNSLRGLRYPKTSMNTMSLIFSVGSLADIHPPCVLQSFVNHGAVLHKVFVVGDRHFCVERPSLKNFPSGPCDRKTIFFNSHQVSKPESSSDLTAEFFELLIIPLLLPFLGYLLSQKLLKLLSSLLFFIPPSVLDPWLLHHLLLGVIFLWSVFLFFLCLVGHFSLLLHLLIPLLKVALVIGQIVLISLLLVLSLAFSLCSSQILMVSFVLIVA
eukprot:superscaffoldBa00002435_g14235